MCCCIYYVSLLWKQHLLLTITLYSRRKPRTINWFQTEISLYWQLQQFCVFIVTNWFKDLFFCAVLTFLRCFVNGFRGVVVFDVVELNFNFGRFHFFRQGDGGEESQEEDSSQSDYEFSLREENIRLKSRLEQVCI